MATPFQQMVAQIKKVIKAKEFLAASASISKISRFELPGLNLPLNWTPHEPYCKIKLVDDQHTTEYVPAQGEGKGLFRTALTDADRSVGTTALPLMTLREFTMMHVMNALTDKSGWEEKIFDDAIAQKWKAEAMAVEAHDVTEKMMDWVIAELRWKAEKFRETGIVSVYNGDVVKSDIAIPQTVKDSLRVAIRALEDVPEKYKDYHPGSDNKVLDIVHPSLFPLIYGQSRVLEDKLIGVEDCVQNCGTGIIIPTRPDEEMEPDLKRYTMYGWRNHRQTTKPYSKNFQWLPCEVDISNPDARITSYINNLHPQKHTELYSIIETIISKTIPLWDRTLTPLANNPCNTYQRIKYELEFDPDPENIPEDERPKQEYGEPRNDFWNRVWQWEQDTRKTVLPEPGDFKPPVITNQEIVDLRKDFGHRGLQIIVKLANVELTPEKPSYEGGTWHIEGQMNEHICATALYYYNNLNITESHLAFRQQSSCQEAEDLSYPQNVHDWLREVYGCDNEGPAVQNVGTITCTEGRLLTFPNILQHQVQPFELVDKSKPGHRKILALFLVDPNIRVISTANVPPQQREWWSEEVDRQTSGSKAIGKLSRELKDKVFEDVDDFPISMEKAKELRLQLMAERSKYVALQKEAFEENCFSLCEH